MRVTTTFHFIPESSLPWLPPSLPPVAEYCTEVAPVLADVSTFDARMVVAMTGHPPARAPARLAVLA